MKLRYNQKTGNRLKVCQGSMYVPKVCMYQKYVPKEAWEVSNYK